nr:MAG TPA_asm: tail collar fiber protein [Caudoviricetes sp.]
MANWNGLELTSKGIALQAKVEAGTTLVITKLKLGSGILPSGKDIKTLTDLVVPEQNLGIGSKVANGEYCKISSTISNTNLTAGYYVRELGVFAQDPDAGEILYMYTTDGAPDYLPAGGGSTVISQEFSVNIAVSDTVKIEVMIDPGALATMGYVQQKITDHNAADGAHNDMVGATATTAGKRGMVPPPAKGDNVKFLTGAGTYQGVATTAQAEAGTDDSAPITAKKLREAIAAMGEVIPVGDVVYRAYLRAGYVKANGATVNRADYPRLVAFATQYSLWTDDPTNEPWKYGKGNGSTTMVLPDYRNRVIQGGDNVEILEAGLPNITGWLQARYMTSDNNGNLPVIYADGKTFTAEDITGSNYLKLSHDTGTTQNFTLRQYMFNASRSSKIYGAAITVQPPSITLVPQIKF